MTNECKICKLLQGNKKDGWYCTPVHLSRCPNEPTYNPKYNNVKK